MGWNWTGYEPEQPPESPLRWTVFDYALIAAAFLVLIVIGIVSAGGVS